MRPERVVLNPKSSPAEATSPIRSSNSRRDHNSVATGGLTSARMLAKAAAEDCLRDVPWFPVIDRIGRLVIG